MKKLFIVAVILMGGVSTIPVLSFTATAQTCDPSSPCVYTGQARSARGVTYKIVVKIDSNHNYVAEVAGKGTYYVCDSKSDDDKAYGNYYVNVEGEKCYFSM